MLAGILAALVLAAAPPLQEDSVSVALKSERFPSGVQACFGMPVLFWLYAKPPFEVFRVPESGGDTWLYGRLPVGKDPGIPFVVGPGKDAPSPYSALSLDWNRNGDFTDDGPPCPGKVSSRNGKNTVFFEELHTGSSGEPSLDDSIDASVRFTYRQDSGALEYGFLYIRRCMTGTVTLDGVSLRIVLMDIDGNGAYTVDDLWTMIKGEEGARIPLRPGASSAFALMEDSLQVSGGRSWRLEAISPDGARVEMHQSDAAPDAAAAARRIPPPPPPRPETEIPVTWLSSIEEAVARALEEGKPILLLLTAPDCPFSQAYLSHTFRDADVAELLGAFVPIHVPPGENGEIAARYDVSGFPFVLILDGELKLKRRIPGYRAAGPLVKELMTVLP